MVSEGDYDHIVGVTERSIRAGYYINIKAEYPVQKKPPCSKSLPCWTGERAGLRRVFAHCNMFDITQKHKQLPSEG